jgi:hypothetical protein
MEIRGVRGNSNVRDGMSIWMSVEERPFRPRYDEARFARR